MAADSAETARALAQRERELDLAIERLVNLRLDPDDDDDAGEGGAAAPDTTIAAAAAAAATPVPSGGISNRGEWVERLLGEMARAGDVCDARARAARFLGDFLAAEQDMAVGQNGVLKRAVLRQHRMHKVGEAANAELRRQLEACQERVRSLEADNYALSLYLRQAQPQGGAMSGHFHPEVF